MNRQMALLKAIAENTPDGLFAKGPDGRYLLLNEGWAKIIGKKCEEAIGKDDSFLFDPDTANSIMSEDQEVIKNKEMVVYEEAATVDGKKLTLLVKKSPLKDTEGSVIGVIGTYVDITELKLLERTIKKANKQLGLQTEISRHDMMNQLSAFAGYTNLLENANGSLEKREILRKMNQSINTLQNQLEFTKQFQELGSNTPLWLNLHSLIKEASEQLDLEDLNIKEKETDIQILADPLFKKVIFNLIENVIRHGKGAKNLSISMTESADRLTLVFEDDGAGIRKEDRHHLFKRGFGMNTGVGLYMCREILGTTDMEIKETSNDGNGARFEITIPSSNYKRRST
jgi:PAS domain S-box-containing protein